MNYKKVAYATIALAFVGILILTQAHAVTFTTIHVKVLCGTQFVFDQTTTGQVSIYWNFTNETWQVTMNGIVNQFNGTCRIYILPWY